MFGIGIWELVLVFSIMLLLFGGKRLPTIATGLGSAIRNFKNALKGAHEPAQKDSHDQLPSSQEPSSTHDGESLHSSPMPPPQSEPEAYKP